MADARRRRIAPIILGVLGCAVLLGLGTWQVQRMGWKEGLIDRLEARLTAEPVALPAEPAPATDEFRRVRLEGRLEPGVARLLTTLRPYGPGYRLIVPVTMADGRTVMVDLGFAPQDRWAATLPEPGVALTATGALFWADGDDIFTPAPDTDKGLFYSRTVEPLARYLDADPLLVVAEAHGFDGRILAQRLGADLPNNHLGYAITWYGLALVWAVMSVLWYRRQRGGPA
jgi:surfeit locus 1 family protein